MRRSLLSLLGEADAEDAPYDPNRYLLYGDSALPPPEKMLASSGSGPPQPPEPPAPLPPPIPEDDNTGGALGTPEPSQFGCWILPQHPRLPTGGSQQAIWDRSATAAKTQIAAQEAPTGQGSTLAAYDERTWKTPFEVSQDVVSTGALINTYTGEVSEVYENCLPPPDREGGDPVREWKNADLRLQAAQGFELRKLQKREIEEPLPAADSGPIMDNATFRQMQAVALESDERCARDKYFNRNDLVPTDPQMTTNPMGFRGLHNMMRINPYIPATQELDNKNWAPNSAPIPTTARFLETRIRLHRDALAGRPGLVEIPPEVQEAAKPVVRTSQTQRNAESAQRQGECAQGMAAPACASAESVARSLRGQGLMSGAATTRSSEPLYGGAASAMTTAGSTTARTERVAAAAHAPGGAASDTGALSLNSGAVQPSSRDEAPPRERRRCPDAGLEAPMPAGTVGASAVRKLYGDKATTTSRAACGAPSSHAGGALVATAEECRRTLSGAAHKHQHNGAQQRAAAGAALTSASDLPDRRELEAAAGGGALLEGCGAATTATTAGQVSDSHRGMRPDTMSSSVASSTLMTSSGVVSGEHARTTDKRGLVPTPTGIGANSVADHVRHAEAPERKVRAEQPEALRGRFAAPDHIVTQRAFQGTSASLEKERVRFPTPRKGHAERLRSGLARINGPASYDDDGPSHM